MFFLFLKASELYTYCLTNWSHLAGKQNFLYSLLTSKDLAIQILRDIAREISTAVILFIAGYKIILNILKVISPTFATVNKDLIFTILSGKFRIISTYIGKCELLK